MNNNKRQFKFIDVLASIFTVCMYIMTVLGLLFIIFAMLYSIIIDNINININVVEGEIINSPTPTLDTNKQTLVNPIKIAQPKIIIPTKTSPIQKDVLSLEKLVNIPFKNDEDEAIIKLNTYRRENGLQECKRSEMLYMSAHEKALYTYKSKSFSHDMMYNDMVCTHSLFTRAWGLDTVVSSENIAISSDSFDMIEDWKTSPAHNAAMLEPDLIMCDIGIIWLPDYGTKGAYFGVLHMGRQIDSINTYKNILECDDILKCKENNINTLLLKDRVCYPKGSKIYEDFVKIDTKDPFTGYYDR